MVAKPRRFSSPPKLWFFALTGLLIRKADFWTVMIAMMVFAYAHILIAALLLISVLAAAWCLLRASGARSGENYFVFALSLISFVPSSAYSYIFFYK